MRHRRGWRQVDLAKRAGVARTLVSQIERGHAWRFGIRTVRRVASALGVSLAWDIGRARQDLSRLLDADHARCGEAMVRLLQDHGWLARPELSFNQYGDRGRIDLLAFHPATGLLLVIELKTVLVDVQDLLGALDVKTRNASRVAASISWRARAAVPVLGLLATRTNRRTVANHPGLFAALALRGRLARAWLRHPSLERRPPGILLTLSLPNVTGSDVRRAGRQRVRLSGPDARSAARWKADSTGRERA